LTDAITIIFTTSTLISHILIVIILLLLIFKKIFKIKLSRIKTNEFRFFSYSILGFIVAFISTIISLYYSEIDNFTPCKLCWFERIAMYPIVPLLLIGSITKDKSFIKWIPIFSISGILISSYHYLLQINISKSEICYSDIPCTERWVWDYGYISIPMMAITAFLVITMISIYGYWIKKEV